MVSKLDKLRMCSTNVSELGGTKFRKVGLHVVISAILLNNPLCQSLHVRQTLTPDLSCLSALDRQSLPAVCIAGDSVSGPNDCFFGGGVAGVAEIVEVVGIAVGDAAESHDRPRYVVVATSLERSHSLVGEQCLVLLVAALVHPLESPDRSHIRPSFVERYSHSSNAVLMMEPMS